MHWEKYDSWESAECTWDKRAESAKTRHPLRRLKILPEIPGITEKTAKNLKLKSFKYMVVHDKGRKITRHFLKHPIRYSLNYLKSLLKKKAYRRDGDFFFYNLTSTNQFLEKAKAKNTLLTVGFSYCQKPHECPSGRFNDQCICDPDNPVCQQCDIGKVLHALPKTNIVPLIIPTVHYIGDKIFELVHNDPNKEVIFLITACEMTLEMFGDFGNMAGVKGIGIRLDGRICNTMRAFELSEEGIKPGLTIVTEETQTRILHLVRNLRKLC